MSKPKLLFLHGAGTSAAIFRTQSRHLAALLAPRFDLIYLQGPLPREPGPGVLPFFDGCGPFTCWMDDDCLAGEVAYWAACERDERTSLGAGVSVSVSSDAGVGAGKDRDGKGGVGGGGEEVAGIEGVLTEVAKRGPFVGVVGFSQGAKVALEVVRRLEEREDRGQGGCPVRVVVAFCGTAPFQGGRDGKARAGEGGEDVETRERGFRERLAKGVVRTESVHVVGEEDPWRCESEKLLGFFDEETRRVIRFRGGHHMPVEDVVNKRVARLILEACEEGI